MLQGVHRVIHFTPAPERPRHLGLAIAALLESLGARERGVRFLCIGSDRSTGDCLGPLVGEQLAALHPEVPVTGTLSEPLHAINLRERVGGRPGDLSDPVIIAIDASLGESSQVGTIHLARGGVTPGAGVGKNLGRIGDVTISATVNVSCGVLSQDVLQSTRLSVVMELARSIAEACDLAIGRLAPASARALAEAAPTRSS